MTTPPPRLFKYFSFDRAPFLETWLVRFTQPGALNDPFEMRPHIAGYDTPENVFEIAAKAWERDVSRRYDDLSAFLGNVQTPFEVYRAAQEKHRLPMINRRIEEANATTPPKITAKIDEMMNENIGVLSLCGNPDDLLMWAHYADSHAGYVVEFDTTHPFFSQKAPPDHVKADEDDAARFVEEYGRLRQVAYSDDRPSMFVVGMTFDELLTKSKHWIYESEWRMLMPPGYANDTVDIGKKHKVCLFYVPPQSAVRVIVGCNASDEVLHQAQQLTGREESKHIVVEKARIDERHYRLVFEAI